MLAKLITHPIKTSINLIHAHVHQLRYSAAKISGGKLAYINKADTYRISPCIFRRCN